MRVQLVGINLSVSNPDNEEVPAQSMLSLFLDNPLADSPCIPSWQEMTDRSIMIAQSNCSHNILSQASPQSCEHRSQLYQVTRLATTLRDFIINLINFNTSLLTLLRIREKEKIFLREYNMIFPIDLYTNSVTLSGNCEDAVSQVSLTRLLHEPMKTIALSWNKIFRDKRQQCFLQSSASYWRESV